MNFGELNSDALVVVAHDAAAQTAENDDRLQRRLDPRVATEAPLRETSITRQS